MGTEGVDNLLNLFGDLPDFPGKRPPKNRPEVSQERNSILDSRYNGVKGKEYTINGVRYIMYTVGQVCKVLGKKPTTLRMWESSGWIPKPSFRTPPPKGVQIPGKASKGRRLYTQSQLDTLIDAVQLFADERNRINDVEAFKQYIHEHWKR